MAKYFSPYLLWPLPFLCFIAGYYGTHFFIPIKSSITSPNLIGQTILDALQNTSSLTLNLKIIESRENKTLKEPLILEQIPAPAISVKPRSTIHVIIAQPPAVTMMPDYTHQTLTSESTNNNLLHKVLIFSNLPTKEHTCIAQYPEATSTLPNIATLYITKNDDLFVMPNFIDHLLFEAEDLCKKHALPFKVHYKNAEQASTSPLLDTARIIEQQPQAGTLFDLKKAPCIHLKL